MSELAAVSPSLKRPLPEDDTVEPTTPTKATSTAVSSALSSPASQSSRDVSMPAGGPQSPPPEDQPAFISSDAAPNPSSVPVAKPEAKRRKITPQERAQAAAEKQAKQEAREKEKAEAAAKREAKEKEKAEAAAKKEEEKRIKAEEQEQKRKAKEAEKLKKEEEHKIKEAERRKKAAEAEAKKLAKERAQPRLTSFFNLPKASPPAPLSDAKTIKASPSPSPAKFITKDEARRKSLSLEPGETVESLFASIPKLNLLPNSDEQLKKLRFLPFNLPKHAIWAPHNRFLPLTEELARVNEHLDSYLITSPNPDPSFTQELKAYKVQRGFVPPPVQSIVDLIHGSSIHPIDLTSPQQPQDLLGSLTMKYFHFGEDVRPPYCGTWTRPQSMENARKLAKNPFKQSLPEVNYDYDSEAEWEEPEDGEDIDSDGDEDSEDGDEDMEGFLDDDNLPDYLQARKGQMSNDLVPICSGIQWEDASGVLHAADGGKVADFSSLKMSALLEPRPPTIDPFTKAYWEEEPLAVVPLSLKDQATITATGSMNPPRVPLQDRSNFLNGVNIQGTVNGKVPKASKVAHPKRIVPADQLPAFKKEIDGSDLTKIALIEHLKKMFPKLKKDEITDTLGLVAHRVGPKLNEKRWVLLAEDAK